MQATDSLRGDHEVILEAIDLLGSLCDLLESGQVIDFDHLETILSFIRSYVDHYHHQKEEFVLFPALVGKGFSGEFGPIGCMLHDHEAGRESARKMAEAIDGMKAGRRGAIGSFVSQSRNYIALLRGHILKENTILFPMADRILNSQEQEQIARAFHELAKNLPLKDQPQMLSEKMGVLKNLYVSPVCLHPFHSPLKQREGEEL